MERKRDGERWTEDRADPRQVKERASAFRKEESRREEGSPNDTDPTKLYRLLYLNEEYASNTNRPPETKGAPVRIISAIVILFDRRSRPFGPLAPRSSVHLHARYRSAGPS